MPATGNLYQYTLENGKADFKLDVYDGKATIFVGTYYWGIEDHYIDKIVDVSESRRVSIKNQPDGQRIYLLVKSEA